MLINFLPLKYQKEDNERGVLLKKTGRNYGTCESLPASMESCTSIIHPELPYVGKHGSSSCHLPPQVQPGSRK